MGIGQNVLLYVAEPMIKAIIIEIAKSNFVSDELKKIKEKFFSGMSKVTGKTAFSIDSTITAVAYKAITDSGIYQNGGDIILDAIEDWIKSTKTKWDDILLTPVISAIREVAGIPDNDDTQSEDTQADSTTSEVVNAGVAIAGDIIKEATEGSVSK